MLFLSSCWLWFWLSLGTTAIKLLLFLPTMTNIFASHGFDRARRHRGKEVSASSMMLFRGRLTRVSLCAVTAETESPGSVLITDDCLWP